VGTLATAFWLWSVPILGLAFTTTPWVAVLMYLLLGVGTGLWFAVNTTVRQAVTPTRLLGRMNAAYRTVSWGVVPFGAAFGGLCAHWFGLRTTFLIAGFALLPIGVFGRRILRPVEEALA
jgi:hypothetical protein